jgi:hypothetical protein
MIALAALLLLAAAAPEPETPEAEARHMAREVMEQLIAGDDHPFKLRTYDGHDVVYMTSGPRASRTGGICQSDSLTVERAPADRLPLPGSSPIREIKAESHYYVVADEREQPLWTLQGNALEERCAAIDTAHYRWFTADDLDAAKSAVIGLTALKVELMKPSSPQVENRCVPSCPGPAELARRIDPLRPVGAWRFDRGDCPKGRWCVDVLLDNVGCGAWSTQLRMDDVEITRFRSARIGYFVGALACGEMEMEREAQGDAPDGDTR